MFGLFASIADPSGEPGLMQTEVADNIVRTLNVRYPQWLLYIKFMC